MRAAGEHLWTTTDEPGGKIGPTCPDCQTIHGSDEVVAVGKFDPAGVHGYRARVGGPLRATRAEAHVDLCAIRGREVDA